MTATDFKPKKKVDYVGSYLEKQKHRKNIKSKNDSGLEE